MKGSCALAWTGLKGVIGQFEFKKVIVPYQPSVGWNNGGVPLSVIVPLSIDTCT